MSLQQVCSLMNIIICLQRERFSSLVVLLLVLVFLHAELFAYVSNVPFLIRFLSCIFYTSWSSYYSAFFQTSDVCVSTFWCAHAMFSSNGYEISIDII